MDDILTDTKNNLEQYAADRQLTAEAEAIRQEALELLSQLAALDPAPADAPPEEFDPLQSRRHTADDPFSRGSVVFGSDPNCGKWIAVSPETLVSLEDTQ